MLHGSIFEFLLHIVLQYNRNGVYRQNGFNHTYMKYEKSVAETDKNVEQGLD